MTTSAAGRLAVFDRSPPALAEAVAQKSLVVFCGAGISMAPPAAVPNWAGFNEALFREIKARAAGLPMLPPEGAKIIASLTVIGGQNGREQVVPTEGFSDAVADLLLSGEYFPALQVLDGEHPNANHAALAQLAKRGVLRAIATTNFDTLIERALRDQAVEFQRFISQEHYNLVGAQQSAALELYKVHGSADVPDSLKDTATQKFRGLPLYVRMKLAALFRRHHVLVLGFSGGDLKFGEDYFGFAQVMAQGGGITWVVRPPRNAGEALVSPRVHEMLAAERAAIVVSELADLFTQLGLPPRKEASTDMKAVEAQANTRTSSYLAAFFKTKSAAPLRCAALCAHLLRGRGRVPDARVIEEATAQALRSGNMDGAGAFDAAVTAIMLARAAGDDSDARRVYDWAMHALRLVSSNKAQEGADNAMRWSKLEALAWNFRGQAFILTGQYQDAADSLARAKAATRDEEIALQSSLASNEAYLALKSGAPKEQILALVRRAAALARRAGNMRALAAAANFESLLLIDLGEYDAALRVIENGMNVVSVSGDARDRAALIVQRAKISRARGRPEEAWQEMEKLIGELQEHPGFAAGMFSVTFTMLGFHPPLRPRLLACAKNLLAEYERGRIAAEGAPPNVPSRGDMEAFRQKLAANEPPTPDSFPSYANPPCDLEEELRRMIIAREFAGRRDELTSLFLQLFDLKLSDADPARFMDIGYALQRTAERTGNEELQVVACSQRMIACQRAGELRRGLQEFEQLRCSDVTRASPAFAVPVHLAGSLLSLIGTVEQAEAHLRWAMTLCREHSVLPGAARAALGLARAFARNNSYKRAAEILAEEANLIAEAGDAALIAQSEDLRGRFQRRLSRRERAMPISIGLSQPLRRAALGPADVAPLRAMVASPEDLLALARCVLGSDLPQEAHALALEASLHFGEARDRRGIVDCLLFLADIAQTQRYWESAHELGQTAAAVCVRVEDRAGEIASRALTAFCLYRLEDLAEAEEEAKRCLLLAEDQPPSRPLLVASFVRAACCDHKGDVVNKAMSMFAFLQGFPAVAGVEDLIPLRDSFQRALTPAGSQR